MLKFLVLLTILFTCYSQVSPALIPNEDNPSIIKKIIQKLSDAAQEGSQKLKEVLEGDYIMTELKKLSLIYRSMAQSILNRFADMLQFLENKIRPGNTYMANDAEATDDSDIGLLIVTMSEESREIIGEIEKIVDDAYNHGIEELKRVLKTKKMNNLINKLPGKLANYVRRKLEEYASQFRSDVAVELRSTDMSFRDLWSRILAKHAKGNEYLEKFVKGPGYSDVYNGLTAGQKEEVDQLVKSLLQVKSGETIELRSSDMNFRDLWSRILAKHAKGNEYLEKFVKGPGYSDVYNSLTAGQKEEVDQLVKSLLQVKFGEAIELRSSDMNFRDLWSRILAKHAKGNEYLEKFVKGPGYSDVYNSLTAGQKEEVDQLVKSLLSNDQTIVSYDSVSTGRVFLDLWSRILMKHANGIEKLETFVKGEGYLDAYNSLTNDEKKQIDDLLTNLLDNSNTAVSFDSVSTARVFRDLWSRLLAKHGKGLEELEKFVNTEGYIETYKSLSVEEKTEIDELLKNIMRKSQ